MQVACLRCHPARKPLRRFSTLRRFPPFLPCRTPVRSISDTHPVDIGHRSGPNRTPFRSHRKTVRHQPGRLSDFNRNTVRFESERCPTSNRIGVRFASEYARPKHAQRKALPFKGRGNFSPISGPIQETNPLVHSGDRRVGRIGAPLRDLRHFLPQRFEIEQGPPGLKSLCGNKDLNRGNKLPA